jgi:hypothetical protein
LFYLKRYLLFFILSSSLLYGFTPEQIAQAKTIITENPSLLYSPQAKQLLQQNNPTSQSSYLMNKKPLNVENIIETDDNCSILNKNDLEIRDNLKHDRKTEQTYKRLNPLEYKRNEQRLGEIKSYQSKREHKQLQRFSLQFFRNKNQVDPNRIVVPADYIINKGDIITFWIYGATNKQEKLEVDSR